MKNEIQKSFDSGSKNYDKCNEIQKLAGKALIDLFFKHLKKENLETYNEKKLKILDLGCGTGEF